MTTGVRLALYPRLLRHDGLIRSYSRHRRRVLKHVWQHHAHLANGLGSVGNRLRARLQGHEEDRAHLPHAYKLRPQGTN